MGTIEDDFNARRARRANKAARQEADAQKQANKKQRRRKKGQPSTSQKQIHKETRQWLVGHPDASAASIPGNSLVPSSEKPLEGPEYLCEGGSCQGKGVRATHIVTINPPAQDDEDDYGRQLEKPSGINELNIATVCKSCAQKAVSNSGKNGRIVRAAPLDEKNKQLYDYHIRNLSEQNPTLEHDRTNVSEHEVRSNLIADELEGRASIFDALQDSEAANRLFPVFHNEQEPDTPQLIFPGRRQVPIYEITQRRLEIGENQQQRDKQELSGKEAAKNKIETAAQGDDDSGSKPVEGFHVEGESERTAELPRQLRTFTGAPPIAGGESGLYGTRNNPYKKGRYSTSPVSVRYFAFLKALIENAGGEGENKAGKGVVDNPMDILKNPEIRYAEENLHKHEIRQRRTPRQLAGILLDQMLALHEIHKGARQTTLFDTEGNAHGTYYNIGTEENPKMSVLPQEKIDELNKATELHRNLMKEVFPLMPYADQRDIEPFVPYSFRKGGSGKTEPINAYDRDDFNQ